MNSICLFITATIHFIQARLKPYGIKISQPAHGIPVGGELEYLDGNTISKALSNRNTLLATSKATASQHDALLIE